jgi:hypothetical protein
LKTYQQAVASNPAIFPGVLALYGRCNCKTRTMDAVHVQYVYTVYLSRASFGVWTVRSLGLIHARYCSIFFREQEGQGAPTENILNGKKPNRVQQEYNKQRVHSEAKERKSYCNI